jgi:phage tail sheath gpL-like
VLLHLAERLSMHHSHISLAALCIRPDSSLNYAQFNAIKLSMQHSVGFMRPQRRTARVNYLQVNLHLAQSATAHIQFCVMGQSCFQSSKDKYIQERFYVNIYLLTQNESRTGKQASEHMNTEGTVVSSEGTCTRYFAPSYTYCIYIYIYIICV